MIQQLSGRQVQRSFSCSRAVPSVTRRNHIIAKDAKQDASTSSSGAAAAGGDVGELTKQLIEADPAVMEQMSKIQTAMARVERAKAAAEELEREYAEASRLAAMSEVEQERELRRKADELMAEAEVRAAEKMVLSAELGARRARAQLDDVAQNAGRVESGKAAAFAAVGGAVGALPLLLAADPSTPPTSALLSFLAAAASAGLFGITYRYAVGRDVTNPNLRGGVVAAFGLVRAASAADVLQLSSPEGPLSLGVVGPAALYAAQSMLMFAFAAALVELGFQQGFIRRVDEEPATAPAAPPPPANKKRA